MKRPWYQSPKFGLFLVLLGVMALLSGCAVVQAVGDFLFGVSADPETGEPIKSGGSIAEILAGIFGFGNIAQGAAAMYLNARRGNWLAVGKSTALGLNRAYEKRELIKDAQGRERWVIAADLLFSEVERAQVAEGVKRDAQTVVKLVEAEHGDPDAKPAPARIAA